MDHPNHEVNGGWLTHGYFPPRGSYRHYSYNELSWSLRESVRSLALRTPQAHLVSQESRHVPSRRRARAIASIVRVSRPLGLESAEAMMLDRESPPPALPTRLLSTADAKRTRERAESQTNPSRSKVAWTQAPSQAERTRPLERYPVPNFPGIRTNPSRTRLEFERIRLHRSPIKPRRLEIARTRVPGPNEPKPCACRADPALFWNPDEPEPVDLVVRGHNFPRSHGPPEEKVKRGMVNAPLAPAARKRAHSGKNSCGVVHCTDCGQQLPRAVWMISGGGSWSAMRALAPSVGCGRVAQGRAGFASLQNQTNPRDRAEFKRLGFLGR